MKEVYVKKILRWIVSVTFLVNMVSGVNVFAQEMRPDTEIIEDDRGNIDEGDVMTQEGNETTEEEQEIMQDDTETMENGDEMMEDDQGSMEEGGGITEEGTN